MKYEHSVIYGGKLYRAGEDVPVVTEEKIFRDNEDKIIPENEAPDGEKTKGKEEEEEPEVKRASKRRTKA